jgi:hypothetical protein
MDPVSTGVEASPLSSRFCSSSRSAEGEAVALDGLQMPLFAGVTPALNVRLELAGLSSSLNSCKEAAKSEGEAVSRDDGAKITMGAAGDEGNVTVRTTAGATTAEGYTSLATLRDGE